MCRFWIVIFSVLLGFFYSGNIVVDNNPEYQFWRKLMDKKVSEISEIRAGEVKQVVLFVGGSTCTFSVEPSTIEEKIDYNVYNFGGAVPMGVRYILSSAFEIAQEGDVLVLALEEHFLVNDSSVGVKRLGLSMARNESESEEKKIFACVGNSLRDKLILRPGSNFIVTYYGKKVLGLPPYRYTMEDFCYRGRLETEYRDDWLQPQQRQQYKPLSKKGITLLEKCQRLADSRGVRLYYTMPWTYTDKNAIETNRALNKQRLSEISQYVEVLEDPFLAAVANPEYFSDSLNHLTKEGSIERSRVIANALTKSNEAN